MDPRVKATARDLEAQFTLSATLASMLTRSSTALLQARSLLKQVEGLSPQPAGPAGDAAKAFTSKLKAVLEGAGDKPDGKPGLEQLNGDTAGLYGVVQQADAAPTAAQASATEVITNGLPTALRQWEEIKANDLPALNRALEDTKLPALTVEANPQASEDNGDEE